MHHDSIANLNPDGNLANMASAEGFFTATDKTLNWLIPWAKKIGLVALTIVVVVSSVNYHKSYIGRRTGERPVVRGAHNAPAAAQPAPVIVMEDRFVVIDPRVDPEKWSDIRRPDDFTDISTEKGEITLARVYGDGVTIKPLAYRDNRHINLPAGTKRVQYKSGDGSPLHLIITVPKGSP